MLKSFRSTLVLVILISASLPVLIFAVLHVKKVYEITHVAALKELELTAKGVSDTIEHETDLIITRLLSLSANRDMAVATRKSVLGVRHYLSGQASDSIKEFILNNPLVSSLYLIDTDLETALAAPESIIKVSPSPVLDHAKNLFLNKPSTTISKYTVVDFNNANFLNKTLGAVSSKDNTNQKTVCTWGVAVLVPVVLDVTNELKGFLVAIIPFENLATFAYPKENRSTVLEFLKNDALIMSSGKQKSSEIKDVISTQVSFQIRNPEIGQNINYGIRILEPSDVRLAGVSRTARLLFFSIIGALVLLMIVAFAFARRLTSPLNELTKVVSSYADGNYEIEPMKVKFSEFKNVVTVLDEMGGKIISQITDLQKAEEKFRGIFENATEGIFQTAKEGQFLTVNPAMTQIFGYDSPEEFINSITDLGKQFYVDSSKRDELMNILKQDGFVKDFEFKTFRKDGSIIDVSVNCHTIKDDNHEIIRLEGTIVDVTKKKRNAEELKKYRENLENLIQERTAELKENQDRLIEAEERSRMLLESAGEGIFGVDTEGRLNFINPSAIKMLGFPGKELMGQKVHPLIHHSHANCTPYPVETCPMFKAFKDGTSHSVDDEVLWRKDGTSFPVEYSSSPMEKEGAIVGAVITFRDITERKAAEERFTALLESAPDAMVVSDETGNMILVNSQAEEVFGYSREELIGQKIEMLVPEEIRDMHPDNRAKFYEDPKRLSMGFRGDFYGVTKDKRKIPIDIGLSPIETEDGLLVVASIRDITERKKMENAIRESEERIKSILNSINTGIIVIDQENRTIVEANPVAEKMIGLPKEKIIGNLCHKFICPREMDDCPIMDHGQTVDNADRILLNAEGQEIPILKTVVEVILGGKPHLVESFVDLTERKKAEEELQRNLEELERFSQLTIGREQKMISLKEEINEMLGEVGKPSKYKIVQKN